MAEPNNLKCNFPKCKLYITGLVIVTNCSHIFCSIHNFQRNSPTIKCPACHCILERNKEVFQTNINPPDELKSMMLNGYSPDMVFEVMTKAVQFWTFQTNLRSMYEQNITEHLRLRLAEKESAHEQLELKIKHYIEKQEKIVDGLQKELQKLTNNLNDTDQQLHEKNRQLFNLQSRYDQLRKQSVASLITKDVAPIDTEPPHFKEFRSHTNRESAFPIQRSRFYQQNLPKINNQGGKYFSTKTFQLRRLASD